MINADQVYCHTLAYYTPTANRTLQQWRSQLVTSTPLTLQTFIKTDAKFVPYKECLGDQTKEGEMSKTCSDQEENGNRYQVSVRKPEGEEKKRLGKPRRRWEDKS